MDKRLSRQSHKLKIGGSNPSPAISLSPHFLYNVYRFGYIGKGCIVTCVTPFLVSMFVYSRVSRLSVIRKNTLYPTRHNPLEYMRSRFADSLKISWWRRRRNLAPSETRPVRLLMSHLEDWLGLGLPPHLLRRGASR